MSRPVRTRPVLTAVIIFILSIGALAPGAYRELNVYDEGVAVYGAERIVHGDVPYRDFWTIYAPGDLYLLAGLLKVFGARLVVERHAWVVLEALVATLVFALAWRSADRAWAILCWSVTVLWTRLIPMFGSPVTPGLVCCLAAVLAIDLFFERRRVGLLVVAGVFVGLCGVFRQDFGLYAVIGICVGLALDGWFGTDARFERDGGAGRGVGDDGASGEGAGGWPALRGLVGRLAYFIGAATAVVAPVAIWLLATVPVSDLISQFVTFPLQIYPRMRGLALPSPPGNPFGLLSHRDTLPLSDIAREGARSLQFYGSILVLAATLGWGLIGRHRLRFLLGVIGLLLVNHGRVRSDVFHLYPTFLFAVIAWGGCVAAMNGRVWWGITGLTSVAVLGVAVLSVRSEWLAEGRQVPYAIPRAVGLTTLHPDEAELYARAIARVQQLVPSGAAIFVGSSRHDLILVNDVLFYFFAERPSATRYHDLHPGVATTADVQASIVRDLDRRAASCVVLRDEFHVVETGNESSVSSGVTILDRYLADHFVADARFGAYRVLVRH